MKISELTYTELATGTETLGGLGLGLSLATVREQISTKVEQGAGSSTAIAPNGTAATSNYEFLNALKIENYGASAFDGVFVV